MASPPAVWALRRNLLVSLTIIALAVAMGTVIGTGVPTPQFRGPSLSLGPQTLVALVSVFAAVEAITTHDPELERRARRDTRRLRLILAAGLTLVSYAGISVAGYLADASAADVLAAIRTFVMCAGTAALLATYFGPAPAYLVYLTYIGIVAFAGATSTGDAEPWALPLHAATSWDPWLLGAGLALLALSYHRQPHLT